MLPIIVASFFVYNNRSVGQILFNLIKITIKELILA